MYVCILRWNTWGSPIPSLPWNCARSENEMVTSHHKHYIQSKQITGIKCNLWNGPQNVKKIAYTTLVRRKLLYTCTAWDPYYKKDIGAVERVQRKAACFRTDQHDHTARVTCKYAPKFKMGHSWKNEKTSKAHDHV